MTMTASYDSVSNNRNLPLFAFKVSRWFPQKGFGAKKKEWPPWSKRAKMAGRALGIGGKARL